MDTKIVLLIIGILLLTSCGSKKPAFDQTKFGTTEYDVTYCTVNELP